MTTTIILIAFALLAVAVAGNAIAKAWNQFDSIDD
jgi:hypothetical protein